MINPVIVAVAPLALGTPGLESAMAGIGQHQIDHCGLDQRPTDPLDQVSVQQHEIRTDQHHDISEDERSIRADVSDSETIMVARGHLGRIQGHRHRADLAQAAVVLTHGEPAYDSETEHSDRNEDGSRCAGF